MAAAASGAILVTGSSTGIGRAIALRLDRIGFRVFAGVRKLADGETLKEQAGDLLDAVILDVTDADSIEAAAARIGEATGGRVAGLVNNAGTGVAGPLEGLEVEEWRRQFEVNVFGQIAVTKALLPMLRAAMGRVVFMSSIGGRTALPMLGPYNASKHAIEAIGDSLRQELRGLGVEVAIIEPGSIATPIWGKAAAGANASRERYDPGLERIYGDLIDRVTRLAAQTGKRGIPPERVAEAVEHALTAQRPKTRYLVGADAKIQARVTAVLPDRAVDAAVARRLRGAR
jgi:NAD(P)-dependent dehydrogenase (short-subunit alcohol dehydrogenase family)